MSLSLDFTWPQTIFSRMLLSDRQRTNSKGHSQKEIFRLHLILSFNCPGYIISQNNYFTVVPPNLGTKFLVTFRPTTLATNEVKKWLAISGTTFF